jgi:GTPase SAR1 family protein
MQSRFKTFIQALYASVVNLDPAVMTLPFGANIDIRDTVRYKDVMKEYNLGPNGGILTSLNLFATKFDEVGCYNLFFLFHKRGSVVQIVS